MGVKGFIQPFSKSVCLVLGRRLEKSLQCQGKVTLKSSQGKMKSEGKNRKMSVIWKMMNVVKIPRLFNFFGKCCDNVWTVSQWFFCVWISSTELIVNPFTLKISSVILPTVCYTVLMMLVWRIWHWINLSNNHLIDIFLYSHHICRVWYWRCEGELSFDHLWELKG